LKTVLPASLVGELVREQYHARTGAMATILPECDRGTVKAMEPLCPACGVLMSSRKGRKGYLMEKLTTDELLAQTKELLGWYDKESNRFLQTLAEEYRRRTSEQLIQG
jgi:hypothetical protein